MVAAVAENGIGAVLAAAEVDGFGFSGFVLYRRETAALVAAVAEGLACAQAALKTVWTRPRIALFDCRR